MEFSGWIIANIVTIVIFFITVGYYKGKVDAITKDNEALHSKLDAYHHRLDVQEPGGRDLPRVHQAVPALSLRSTPAHNRCQYTFRPFRG
jgi:hypothetical protein